MDIALFAYLIGAAITFWASLICAEPLSALDRASSNEKAVVSLVAGIFWPLLLVGLIEIGAVAFIATAARRFAESQ